MTRRQRPSMVARYWSRAEVGCAVAVAFAAGLGVGLVLAGTLIGG